MAPLAREAGGADRKDGAVLVVRGKMPKDVARKFWRFAGGGTVGGFALGFSADFITDLGRFLQMVLLPEFADPALAARVLGGMAGALLGAAISLVKTGASGFERAALSGSPEGGNGGQNAGSRGENGPRSGEEKG